jgi:hypothetical protein
MSAPHALPLLLMSVVYICLSFKDVFNIST